MKAMLFAAGLGTRLRPLTDTLPKCLVPVNGRPMIDYPLLLLRHYGIREIVVNVHHHAERVEEHLGDGSRFGVDIAYSREPVLLDTGGGLLGAKRFLDQDTFVIMNSDVLIDSAAGRGGAVSPAASGGGDPGSAQRPASRGVRCHLDRCRRKNTEAACTMTLRGAGPVSLKQYMFTGVHVVEPRIFQYMEGPEPFSITRTTYPRMLDRHRAPLRLSLRRRLAGYGHAGAAGDHRNEAGDGSLRPHYL